MTLYVYVFVVDKIFLNSICCVYISYVSATHPVDFQCIIFLTCPVCVHMHAWALRRHSLTGLPLSSSFS